jgi:hypothetical protein
MCRETQSDMIGLYQDINVRKYLAALRQRWNEHSPTNPFCLTEELEPNVSISHFCVSFLLNQRARRLVGDHKMMK